MGGWRMGHNPPASEQSSWGFIRNFQFKQHFQTWSRPVTETLLDKMCFKDTFIFINYLNDIIAEYNSSNSGSTKTNQTSFLCIFN